MDTKLQIRLDFELKKQANDLAESHGQGLSQVTRDLLVAYVLSGGQTSVSQVPTVSLTELSLQVSALDNDVKQLFGVLLDALSPIRELVRQLKNG